MQPISISVIRNVLPDVFARELLSVQRMSDGAGEVFKLHTKTEGPDDEIRCYGNRRHSILKGWERNYHGTWVPDAVWWKIKIGGL